MSICQHKANTTSLSYSYKCIQALASATVALFMAGCAAKVVQAPHLTRNNNNGSDEYKVVVRATNDGEAISMATEEAKKFCKSLKREPEILGNDYNSNHLTNAREVTFNCWDLKLAEKLRKQRQQASPTSNQRPRDTTLCLPLPLGSYGTAMICD